MAVQDGEHWQARLQHDARGLEVHRQLSGGVQQGWQYDALGRPTRQQVQARGGARQRAYHWRGADQLTAIDDSLAGTTHYNYDALGALTGARYPDDQEELRLSDAVGNLFRSPTLSDRSYGPGGQLRAANGTRYHYDVEGNLLRKSAADGQQWQYSWDGAGQLVGVRLPNGYHVTFIYDALGRRIAKRYRGRVSHWGWASDVPLHEWSELELGPEAGSVQDLSTWLFEEGRCVPTAKLTGRGAYSVVADHLGTPLALYDEQGQPTWTMTLDSYGAVRQGRGRAQDCPFRYQGQYEDTETGLYYNRFRYYDPEVGRYISQDPLGLLGGDRLYEYVDNPSVLVDSLGLLDEFEIAPYKSSLHVNDNLTAHELLQNAWLRNNNHVTGREGGIARQNPAMALTESPLHKNIGDMQRAKGLHDPQILKKQSALRNINENSVITKNGIENELIRRGWEPENARSFAHERVSELRKKAIQFGVDNNLIKKCT
jgi:RHS repeat-associated protein